MKNLIFKSPTDASRCRSINIIYKSLICVFSLLFLIFHFAFADTIPPLPIDDLKKIDIYYNDTITNKYPLDTFYLKLYGISALGGNLSLARAVGKHSFLTLNIAGAKDRDFSDYISANASASIGWLTRHFYNELSLESYTRIRDKRLFQNVMLSYIPVWFVGNGTMTLKNRLRGAQYTDTDPVNLFAASSELNYNVSTIFGILNSQTTVLFQGNDRDTDKFLLTSATELTDLITISDIFFIKPGIKYNIEKQKLGFSSNLGLLLGSIKTFFNIEHNSVVTFYFDTLYRRLYPVLVNSDLNYPVSDLNINISVIGSSFQVSGNYQQSQTALAWSKNDTWLIPELSVERNREFALTLENKLSFYNNMLTINYSPDKFNLVPVYKISDFLSADINKIKPGIKISYVGRAYWYDQVLPAYLIISPEISYQWKSVRIFGCIENIFNKQYPILSDRSDLGRKYIFGLEIIPEKK